MKIIPAEAPAPPRTQASSARAWSALLLAFLLSGCHAPEQSADTDSAVIYLVEDVPAGLNYDGPAASLHTSQVGIVNLMDPLLEYAASPEIENGVQTSDFSSFEGSLAENWVYDPAEQSWRIDLRKGVYSCAGNELTADDVLYTFARAKSVSGAAPVGWFLASVASVASFDTSVFDNPAKRRLGDEISKLGRYSVKVFQSAPNPLFPHVLTSFALRVFDSQEMRKHATESDPWSHQYVDEQTSPGFGPYCTERWIKGDEFVLTANPYREERAPSIKRIVFKRVPLSSNRFVIMKMGEGDLSDRLTPREFEALAGLDNLKVIGLTGNETLFLHMNFKSPPFDNPLIRRAISAAVPYDWIINNGYRAQAKQWLSVVPTRYPGVSENFQPPPGGLEAARQLLSQAGYPNGKGLEEFRENFQLSYVAEKQIALGPIANAIRAKLREVGIPVELNPIPLTQFGDRTLVKRDLPFALSDQEKPVVVDAGYAIQLFFASPSAGGVNNMTNYHNDSVDALWASARTTANPSARAEFVARALDQIAADIAWLPLAEFKTQWATHTELYGFRWYPDNSIRFSDLYRKEH